MKETWRRTSWGEAVGPVQRQTVYCPAKRHRPCVCLQPKRHRHGPAGPPAVWEPRPRSAYCAFISCFIAQFWVENQVSGTTASRRATAAEPRAALKWRDTLFGGLNAPCSLGEQGRPTRPAWRRMSSGLGGTELPHICRCLFPRPGPGTGPCHPPHSLSAVGKNGSEGTTAGVEPRSGHSSGRAGRAEITRV